MPYAKLHTTALTDPRLLAVGPDGFTLWAKGLLYSVIHLTDGAIPASALAIIGIGIRRPKAVADALVSAGLWQKNDEGWQVSVTEWSETQQTSEQVLDTREQNRLRKQKQRERLLGSNQESVTEMSQCDKRDMSRNGHADVTPPEVRSKKLEVEGNTPLPPKGGAAWVEEVIGYLNSKTGKRFTTRKGTVGFLNARYTETPKDRRPEFVSNAKLVIDHKCSRWLGTDQAEYLRPETLFASSHWESYLMAAEQWHKEGRPPKPSTNGVHKPVERPVRLPA